MNTWYEISKYSDEITPVDVIKETEKMIVIFRPATKWFRGSESSTLKKTSHHTYYPSFAEAKQAMLDRLKDKIVNLRHSLDCAEESLKKLDKAEVAEVPR